MKKWNELRDMLIQSMVEAETQGLKEQEKYCRSTLEKMDALDKKYHKSNKN